MALAADDPIWKVTPDVQAVRDRQALALKEEELAADPTNPALQRDVAFTRAQVAQYGGGGGMPTLPTIGGAPSDPTAPRPQIPFQATNPRIQQLEGQRDTFEGGLNQRLDTLSAGRDVAARDLQQTLGQPMPERPKLNQLPTYTPKPYSQEDALGFAAIATAFMSLAGLRARQPLTAAMAAAGSAMQGYTAGRFAQVKQDLDVFRSEFTSGLAANKQMLEEYQSIINDRNMSRAEKMSMWQVAAARWNDEATKGMLRLGQYDRAIQSAYTLLNSQNRMEQSSQQFYDGLQNRLDVAGMRGGRAMPPGMESAIPSEHAGLHGEEYLATLPEGIRNSVKAIAEGRASLNALSIRQGARERFLQMVSQYDPAFDATRFPGNQAFAQVVGRRGAQLSLAGQEAAGLAEATLKEYQNVWRTDFTPLNEVIARVAQGGGSADERRVSSRINSLVNVYARAINPTGQPTVSDKEHAREILNRADSPQAFKAAIDTLIDEIHIAEGTFSQVQSRGAARASELGAQSQPAAPSQSRYQEGQTATNPATGQKLRFQGGQWVPQ